MGKPYPVPPLGLTVVYRSRTGDYSLAAIVTANVNSINPVGVERGHVPALTGPDCVHLVVFTPGLPRPLTPETTGVVIDTNRGLGNQARPFSPTELAGVDIELEDGQFIGLTAFGGTYAEHDIPQWLPADRLDRTAGYYCYDEQEPGTWTYPGAVR